ncbi:ABP1 [Cyberlindnera jadinii]|uniref:ABP1 protein n=1 Tax=Cyberlindnera jadinii (strain ATCC 18201 / CBS 1600 / BCRC 20928 / JCM 3617 / NBRC 0987 / NRRL Y-1542) TaxID=983966 RepID=A0A0H5C3Z4_CYBJN|nr:ABP1 [Cyberlindnera jadinii]
MEQIDLSTHGKDIQKSYETVVRGEGEFTWVIYGPDSSKAYQVAETGDDFDEFLQSFDESQIQFGLARINPPNSDVYKNLLIGWCPDSAPLKSRSSFAQNFAEVSRLLKGYHVQVTARDSDDLDKDDLLSRLSAAAGARYSIQASRSNASSSGSSSKPAPKPFVPKPASSFTPKPTPVSKPAAVEPPVKKEPEIIKPAVAKKYTAQADEDEWDEPEIKERDLTKEPLKPNVSSWKPIGKVNLQDVIREEQSRPDPRLEVEQLKQKDKLKRDQELDDYLKTKTASGSAKVPLPSSGINKSAISGGISKDFGSDNGKTPAQLWAERKQKAAWGCCSSTKGF